MASLRDVLQVVTVIVIALAMAPAVAHALEFPGKRRLGRDAYFATQRIYYPGFTILGAAEPLAIVFTAILLFMAERRSVEFWLALVALGSLVAMQLVYWIFTHPLNKVWLGGERLTQAGAKFFGLGPAEQSDPSRVAWTTLRDRWEYSHVARAALAVASLVAAVIAVA